MTSKDILELIAYLKASFPYCKLEPNIAVVWAEHLLPFDVDLIKRVATQIVHDDKFFPTISRVVELAVRIRGEDYERQRSDVTPREGDGRFAKVKREAYERHKDKFAHIEPDHNGQVPFDEVIADLTRVTAMFKKGHA